MLRVEELEDALATGLIATAPIPREARFLAGKMFLRSRGSGGPRTGVLPDFFIGAHGTEAQLALPTQDARRYRTYLPTVQLIAPKQ